MLRNKRRLKMRHYKIKRSYYFNDRVVGIVFKNRKFIDRKTLTGRHYFHVPDDKVNIIRGR